MQSKCCLLGLLKLLSALDGISFIFGSPLSHLAVSLGHASLKLGLGLLLLFKLLSQQITVMAGGLQAMGKSVLGLKTEKIGLILLCMKHNAYHYITF